MDRLGDPARSVTLMRPTGPLQSRAGHDTPSKVAFE